MIVLDEQLGDPRIAAAIKRWYKGAVISIEQLRPGTNILGEAMPTLLRRVKYPTFVTINYKDFWDKIAASEAYCVVCLKLPPGTLSRSPRHRARGLEHGRVPHQTCPNGLCHLGQSARGGELLCLLIFRSSGEM